MQRFSFVFIRAAACVGAIASLSFAGVEPSPFLPIWRFIIHIIGG